MFIMIITRNKQKIKIEQCMTRLKLNIPSTIFFFALPITKTECKNEFSLKRNNVNIKNYNFFYHKKGFKSNSLDGFCGNFHCRYLLILSVFLYRLLLHIGIHASNQQTFLYMNFCVRFVCKQRKYLIKHSCNVFHSAILFIWFLLFRHSPSHSLLNLMYCIFQIDLLIINFVCKH